PLLKNMVAQHTFLGKTEAFVHFDYRPVEPEDFAAQFVQVEFIEHVLQNRIFRKAAGTHTACTRIQVVRPVTAAVLIIDLRNAEHSNFSPVTGDYPVMRRFISYDPCTCILQRPDDYATSAPGFYP